MTTPTRQEMTLEAIRSVPLFGSLDDEAAGDLRNLLVARTRLLVLPVVDRLRAHSQQSAEVGLRKSEPFAV